MSTSLRRGYGGGRVAAATPKGETSGSERVNESITIAVAEGHRNGEVRVHSTISNDLHAIVEGVAH